MVERHVKGIPYSVQKFIKIHVSYLYRRKLFAYHELEDIRQELLLFYIDKFYRCKTEVPDELVFIALKRQALHILRSRTRQVVHSGVFFTLSLNDMFEDTGIEPEDDFTLAKLENHILFLEVMKQLDPKEKQMISLVLKGVTVTEARRICHVRNDFFAKLCSKIEKMIKK